MTVHSQDAEDAIVVTAVAPGRIEFVNRPDVSAGALDIAGRTQVSLVSPGTELAMAYSAEPRYPLPVALGYASVFTAESVGSDVRDVAPGDLVMCMGPHASYQRVNANDAWPLPTGLSPASAVFSRVMNVPMTAIATSPKRPGDRAAVVGLGLVGQMSARVLSACGFATTGVDASDARRGLLPPGIPSDTVLPESSYDLILECSGREENVLQAAKALRGGGELVLAGVPWHRRSDAYLFDLLDPAFHRYLTVRSGWEWQVPRVQTSLAGGIDIRALMTRSLELLASGAVDVSGLADVVAPADALGAYDALRSRVFGAPTFLIDWMQSSILLGKE